MKQCRECHGHGLVNLGPVNRGGPDVWERCDCQPPQIESDQELYSRRAQVANAISDDLMAEVAA